MLAAVFRLVLQFSVSADWFDSLLSWYLVEIGNLPRHTWRWVVELPSPIHLQNINSFSKTKCKKNFIQGVTTIPDISISKEKKYYFIALAMEALCGIEHSMYGRIDPIGRKKLAVLTKFPSMTFWHYWDFISLFWRSLDICCTLYH